MPKNFYRIARKQGILH